MHMDIAIFKCISSDRMEQIKNETYGKQTFNKVNRTVKLKMSLSMFLNVFV